MEHATQAKERFKVVFAVHLFLVKDKEILLLRRYNTGWSDGNYSVPAGHVDGDEKVSDAMMREAREEIGIAIQANDLQFAHVMHRKQPYRESVEFFFSATHWQGKPINSEPHKCDDVQWFPMGKLPRNTVSYVKTAIENYQRSVVFSEVGW